MPQMSCSPKHPDLGFKGEWGPRDPNSPLHDLVIRHIAEYLVGKNNTLVALMRVCRRFYALRDIFIGQLVIDSRKSDYAIEHKCYGWNKCHTLYLDSKSNEVIQQCKSIPHLQIYHSDLDETTFTSLSKVHTLVLYNCGAVNNLRELDLSHLRNVNTLIIDSCTDIFDVSALGGVKKLMLNGLRDLRVETVKSLNKVPILNITRCWGVEDIFRDGSTTSDGIAVYTFLTRYLPFYR